MQFIPYYRVSTVKQGQSGLGLEAQKSAVLSVIGTGTILKEYTDIETGKNDNRPALKEALQLARQTGATLVIAKLDRLSRNLTFISTLMDSKISFIAADMPTANNLTIHIYSALAQWERETIANRTKTALQALKARGKQLGSPANFTEDVRKLGPLKRKEIANSNSNNQKAKKLIKLLSNAGKTLREITVELNEAGFKTSTGKQFHPEQVRRLLKAV